MILITPTLDLDESELRLEYIRAAGPGGQNVNGLLRQLLVTGWRAVHPLDLAIVMDEMK